MSEAFRDDAIVRLHHKGHSGDSNVVCWMNSVGNRIEPQKRDQPSVREGKFELHRVAVILGYFEGQRHVAEQLHSIFKQSHNALHVYLCDDNSPTPFDVEKVDIESRYLSKLSFGFRTRNVGFTNNFLNALASIDLGYEYFAFSDQDDIWYPHKLERAIGFLADIPDELPALYCARTEVTDESCSNTLGYSPFFSKQPSFENALIQSIAGGNTMVFNKTARDLIMASSLNESVVSHDWWCYQIITGAGGKIFYDPKPCLKYRQHGNNLVGSNASWAARFVRLSGIMQGHFREWNDINIKALSNNKHLLTEHSRRVLNNFIAARQAHFFKRIRLFMRSGIYRQTLFGNLGLVLGVLFNRV